MRKASINEPIENLEGRCLSKTIHNRYGGTLIGSNTPLNRNAIEQIRRNDISSIFIQDAHTEEIRPIAILDHAKRTILKSSLDTTISDIRDLINTLSNDENLDLKSQPVRKRFLIKGGRSIISTDAIKIFKNTVNTIYEQLPTRRELKDINFTSMRMPRDFHYEKMIDVCIRAMAFGKVLRFSSDFIKDLGFSALVYDLGLIHHEFLNQMTALIDRLGVHKGKELSFDPETKKIQQTIRQHVEIGHTVILGNKTITPYEKRILYANVAGNHHKGLNNAGYGFSKGIFKPLKSASAIRAKESSMSPSATGGIKQSHHYPMRTQGFTLIIGMLDTYESIIYDKVYRQGQSHESARNYMQINADEKFSDVLLYDKCLVDAFLNTTPCYALGTTVKIKGDQKNRLFVVKTLNPKHLNQPVLVSVQDGSEIDLKETQVLIEEYLPKSE